MNRNCSYDFYDDDDDDLNKHFIITMNHIMVVCWSYPDMIIQYQQCEVHLSSLALHGGIMKWTNFLHDWPFVRRIHQSLADSLPNGE